MWPWTTNRQHTRVHKVGLSYKTTNIIFFNFSFLFFPILSLGKGSYDGCHTLLITNSNFDPLHLTKGWVVPLCYVVMVPWTGQTTKGQSQLIFNYPIYALSGWASHEPQHHTNFQALLEPFVYFIQHLSKGPKIRGNHVRWRQKHWKLFVARWIRVGFTISIKNCECTLNLV